MEPHEDVSQVVLGRLDGVEHRRSGRLLSELEKAVVAKAAA